MLWFPDFLTCLKEPGSLSRALAPIQTSANRQARLERSPDPAELANMALYKNRMCGVRTLLDRGDCFGPL